MLKYSLIALLLCGCAAPVSVPAEVCQPDQEFRFDGCLSRGGVTDPFANMPSPLPEPDPPVEPLKP